MSKDFGQLLGNRIREYAESTGQHELSVMCHGGEPLLIGAQRFEQFVTSVREAADQIQVRFGVQTNGVLLDERFCDIFTRHDVKVGVSLDGNEQQSARRVDHAGKSSWARAVRGIDNLKAYSPKAWSGLLCVIDLTSDPKETIDALCQLHPPAIDLLHPHITHDMAGDGRERIAAEFGVWMTTAMLHWMSDPNYANVRIRVFEDALQAVATQRPRSEWFGRRGVPYVVVETDGSYDVLDLLKVIGADSSKQRALSLRVQSSSIADAEIAARALMSRSGLDTLPSACGHCRWKSVCNGGHPTARFSSTLGFNNSSVYCEGLQSMLDYCARMMNSYRTANPERTPSAPVR